MGWFDMHPPQRPFEERVAEVHAAREDARRAKIEAHETQWLYGLEESVPEEQEKDVLMDADEVIGIIEGRLAPRIGIVMDRQESRKFLDWWLSETEQGSGPCLTNQRLSGRIARGIR